MEHIDFITNKRKKFDMEDINLLLEHNILMASNIDIELEHCMDPTVLSWLRNYDGSTCEQPLSLYYCLMTCIGHLSIQSTVLQWNSIPRHLNLYSIILGYSGTLIFYNH